MSGNLALSAVRVLTSMTGTPVTGSYQQQLHEQVPLARAMQVTVVERSDERVILSAPLAPNVNLHDTAFGGSIATLATLAAWTLVGVFLEDRKIDASIVVRRNSVDFLAPVRSTFIAQTEPVTHEAWTRFESILTRRGLARVKVQATVQCEGELCARFDGEFVAIGANYRVAAPSRT